MTDSPNYDTASINAIFNRRDSRYETRTPTRASQKPIHSKIGTFLIWIVSFLIPLNYNLPWKLLCIINTSFVIIVIGIANGSSQSTAFTFANGFVCGIGVAVVCFIIIILSFMTQILPRSPDNGSKQTTRITDDVKDNHDIQLGNISSVGFVDSKNDISLNSSGQKLEDFSLFEILDESNRPAIDPDDVSQIEAAIVDDDNYKGWMIEFIGDYEQRNTADIKLKSIYVRIEDRVLHLCKPKNSHDFESTTLPVFANQRIYDLNKVSKFSANLLIPKAVRNKQKYVWSKKYPIRLEFQDINEKTCSNESTKLVQLTLFAKSCREKEEWFRRFKRIVEDNRLCGNSIDKRSSLKSDEEESTNSENINESFFGSLKRFRRRSPSPKGRESVQTSQSSHLLSDPSKRVNGDNEKQKIDLPEPASPLIRTKSCELLNTEQKSSLGAQTREQEVTGNETRRSELDSFGDDSTLTRETAELFSQAVEYSNFVDSQPSLNYRDYIDQVIRSGREATPTSDWFNSLTSRIFYDVFSHGYWSVWFKRKIQRKLYRIRLPYFMETLTLTKIDLGTSAPQFLNVVSHNFDSCGLSIDFEMAYSGGLTMTFETKLNLLKIKSDNNSANSSNLVNNLSGSTNVASNQEQQSNQQQPQQDEQQPGGDGQTKDSSSMTSESSSDNVSRDSGRAAPPLSSSGGSTRTSGESTSDSDDSDSDSSSDSSFDEAEPNEISDWEDYGAEKTRQNIVKFVDRIASSRYFQQATENRYIKRKLQDISNCPLVLVVQIQSLNGILTVNVPPPQTDRIWYGFKPQPELTLKALPKMGDRELNLSHVTDWIERKLAEEFRKILVIPNMEDILLPVLKSDHLQYVNATR